MFWTRKSKMEKKKKAAADRIMNTLIFTANKCDLMGCCMEAHSLYQDGLRSFKRLAGKTHDVLKKKDYHDVIKNYSRRADELKRQVQCLFTRGDLLENITITEGSLGYNYKQLFAKYLTIDIKEVLIAEPWVYTEDHFKNLVSLLELIIKRCHNLRYVRLVTTTNHKAPKKHALRLNYVRSELAALGIMLNLQYDKKLNDRKIILGSGIIIKIDRGLHIFDNSHVSGTFYLGFSDQTYRPCLQTNIDIYESTKG